MKDNKKKFTNSFIEELKPQEKDHIIWDSEVKGFGIKVTPKGKKMFFLYYRTKTGTQRKPAIGEYGSIKLKIARDIASDWLQQIACGQDPSGLNKKAKTSPTVNDLSERYIKDHIPHLKPTSGKEDKRLWEKYILPSIGNIKLTQLDRDAIAKLHKSFSKTPYMANRVLGLLNSSLNLAEEWGMKPEGVNPCKYVKKYKEKKREEFLSPEEFKRLNNTLIESIDAQLELSSVIDAVRLLMYTGCRLNEILTLKWEYIDFDNRMIHLPDSKTGEKTLYLASKTLDIIKNIDTVEGNPYVITGRYGQGHLINLQKPWRRIRQRAGLNNLRLHDLRHSFASVAVAQGMSLPIIGALLGHKNVNTTARYAHLAGSALNDAADLIVNDIDEAIKSTLEKEE